MGGKSSGSDSVESKPWEGAIPFLLGSDNPAAAKYIPKGPDGKPLFDTPGLFPEASKLFQSGGLTNEQQNVLDFQKQNLLNRVAPTDAIVQGAVNIAHNRPFDVQIQGPQTVTAGQVQPERVTANSVSAPQVDLTQARQSQGVLDPTQALSSLLSGNVNNEVLAPQIANIISQVTRNTNENILPQIRSGAISTGQMGSSRQGIAEGLAASRAQQDLSTGLAPLIGQAYENAQNRQFSTANTLNQQAADNATGNANRTFAAEVGNADRTFNADTGNANRAASVGLANNQLDLQGQQLNNQNTFQNNAQNIQGQQHNLNNLISAMNIFGQGLNLQDTNTQQAFDLLDTPYQRGITNLQNFADIIQPGASLGGTQTSVSNPARNPLTSILGGATSGATLGSMVSTGAMAGPVGAAIGGGLGILSSLF